MEKPARPKVLVCLPFLTPAIGGGAFVLANLLEPLGRLGFDIQVLYFQEEARDLVPPDLTTHFIPKRTGSARFYAQYWGAARRLAGILRDERPDLILCNAYQPFWLALAARRLSGLKTPVITQEQNNLAQMFDGARWGALRLFLVRKLDPSAERIIVPAEGLARHVIELGIPEGKIARIPNPIPLERIRKLSPEPAGHPWFDSKDAPVLLNVGALEEQKDQKTLLRAFAALRAAGRDAGPPAAATARLAFVGDGPLRPALEAEAQRLGVRADVAFLGLQKNPFKFMARADAFVLSSRYEGFGLVLAEAMACGCPVVSTDCPYGPGEIVAHGDSGLLSPVRDAGALSDNVLKTLTDRALRERLVAGGLRRAEDFSSEAVAGKYAQLIRSCLRAQS